MAKKGSKLPQFLAAVAANLAAVAHGAIVGWLSPIIPQLQKYVGSLESPISNEQISWIPSLLLVGIIIGSFGAGYLGKRWGRKRALLFSVVPILIGWALVATAGHIAQFYVAQIIFGLAMSIHFTNIPIYCGEIAETSIRGTLGSLFHLFITIGILYGYAIGPFVSYTVFWIVCAIVPVIFFVCFMMMPESPHFLLSQGRREEAIASLARLRNKSEEAVQKEADEIQVILDEAIKNQVSTWDLFKVKANFKALMYSCAMVFFQQFSGNTFIVLYMHTIFIAAKGLIPMEIAPIIIGVVKVLASMMTSMIVDRSGRRILLVFSSIGETVSLFAMGLYFYLKEVQHADNVVEQISWLPVVALIIYFATFCIGWGTIPWLLMGEIFASNVKAKGSSITVFVCWFLAFIITKVSSNVEEAFNGKYAVFWMFSGFCIVSIFFTVLLLPETKGKSLQQIQNELKGTLSVNVENRKM